MASSMSNASSTPNDRKTHFPTFDQVSSVKAPLHFGTGFGTAKSGWNNSIWANSRSANTFTDGAGDAMLSADHSSLPVEADQSQRGKIGSGSLLPASQSDGWNGRTSLPWPNSVNNSSPVISRNSSHNVSPIRQRKTEQNAIMSDLNGSSMPLPSANRPSFGQMTGDAAHNTQRHQAPSFAPQAPTATLFSNLGDSRLGESHPIPLPSEVSLGSTGFVTPAPSTAQFGTMPGEYSISGTTVSQPQRASGINSDKQTTNGFWPPGAPSKPSGFSQTAGSRVICRPTYSTTADMNNGTRDREDYLSDQYESQTSNLDRLNLHGINPQHPQRTRPDHPTSSGSQMLQERSVERFAQRTVSSDRISFVPVSGMAENSPVHAFDYGPAYHGSTSIGNRGSATNDPRHEPSSSFCSGVPTPPVISNPLGSSHISYLPSGSSSNHMALLERKLRGLQPYQTDQHFLEHNPLHLSPAHQQPGGMTYQAQMQMNPLARPYAMPAYATYSHLHAVPPHNPRHRRNEHESLQVIRSPLLEDFRTNSKTNKRCELRDIYHHVVEFSGDQHGSRFIQQKLETANSDEKDQIFSEIQPNAIQLMTDVFGNYVIQKLFEHGNQTQKKTLAIQMKGRVLALSMQPYGCRVVQKALEHVLVDQQASIVKELENHVLKCVNDQNGNHVVQKAVERVPARYIQFIIGAFNEQIQRLATHAYGCRVIQRMLEHCEDSARRSILHELRGCVSTLIFDQFGNYVIQHVIENGAEEDRSQIIAVVMSRIFQCSRHKFASNVVEKSIEFGEPGQKAEILRLLTTATDQGGNPALALVCDGYGNYVIQKALGHLQGAERESIVDQIRAHLLHLKKVNNNSKQVAAIERLVNSTDTDSNPNISSQSSSLPSTNASTVEGPTGSLQMTKKVELGQTGTASPATTLHLETS